MGMRAPILFPLFSFFFHLSALGFDISTETADKELLSVGDPHGITPAARFFGELGTHIWRVVECLGRSISVWKTLDLMVKWLVSTQGLEFRSELAISLVNFPEMTG